VSGSVDRMAMSPFIRRLRDLVGNELLVLPSVSVLPRDDRGRVLLVRIIDSGLWATIGGAVEPDESPQEAARREAQEEAGVELQLGPVRAVVGGPEYRLTYPNGDQTSYVVTVYDAIVVGGTPRADGDETSAVEWWDTSDLPYREMGTLTRALLRDVGISEELHRD
jgi:ADP-ribose pyrophosphatase YjhB (NUDIX family)